MKRGYPWLLAVLAAGLLVSACGSVSTPVVTKEPPAKLVSIEGSDLKYVTLTARAAQRIDIQTVSIGDAAAGETQRRVIPYAAVLYDTGGNTWVYTNPNPLTFLRRRITVDRVVGGVAILSESLPPGTAVVTVGGAELYGVETGVSK